MSYTVGIIIISDRAYSGERKDGCIDVFEATLDNRFKIEDKAIVAKLFFLLHLAEIRFLNPFQHQRK